MDEEILEQAIKDIEKLANSYSDGGSQKGTTKEALEAIQKITEIALENK